MWYDWLGAAWALLAFFGLTYAVQRYQTKRANKRIARQGKLWLARQIDSEAKRTKQEADRKAWRAGGC